MKLSTLSISIATLFFIACSNEDNIESENKKAAVENIGSPNIDKKQSTENVDGYFLYSIGEDGGKLTEFDREYSDITIQKDQLVIRLKSRDGVVILMTLSGPEVDHNPVRKYYPVGDTYVQSPYKVSLSFLGVYDDDNKNYNLLKRGEVIIENIDFKNGMIQGNYVQMGGRFNDVDDEYLVPYHGSFSLSNLVVQELR